MEDVLRELQIMKQTQEEAMEVQRQGIQVELEKVREELQQVKSESVMLKEEIKLLKAQKETPKQRSEQATPVIKKAPRQSTTKSTNKKNTNTPSPKSYAQITVLNSNKNAAEKGWTEVTSSSQKKKSNPVNLPRLEPEKRRVIFRREPGSPQKLEEYLMLVLNKSLQKTEIPAYIRFLRVGNVQSGAISALLTEKLSAEDLVREYSNVLIRAAKSLDKSVIGVEGLERWQRLKVHGMPLGRYFGEGKIELLSRKIESSTGIKLKTKPRWLINEAQLEERMKSDNGRGSAIVITVGNSTEASQLCFKRLRFGGVLKVVEKYWEVGPSSICISCAGIGHD